MARLEFTATRQAAQHGSVIRYRKESPGAMPQWLAYPVETRKDWEAYKKRLDPHSPGRWPAE